MGVYFPRATAKKLIPAKIDAPFEKALDTILKAKPESKRVMRRKENADKYTRTKIEGARKIESR
jgi:hypothetical protein